MAILIDKNTTVLIQGITGGEGRKALERMKDYHTRVLCGVTPGKGGQEVDGTPVYNSVREALEKHKVNASLIMVPPLAAKGAVLEALDAGLRTIVCVTENIPLADAAVMVRRAREVGAVLIGPGSVGVMSPGLGRMGPIGGPRDVLERVYEKGNVGVISKSGGMTNEVSFVVRQAGLGQSTAIGMGGEMLVGSAYADLLRLFEKDDETKAVVLFGELGGTYEEEVARLLKNKEFTKPLIVFIAGKFAERIAPGQQFGHAGAMIERGKGKPSEKMRMLKSAGAIVAERFEDIGLLVRDAL
ncbi:succinate--CoA ligase subunit alpha [Candidatus Woesearchaeota archaeon]|nr:MAG: succinate--CoA ligase subunit alpha [Candidatus Woesearchaeota archaeon]